MCNSAVDFCGAFAMGSKVNLLLLQLKVYNNDFLSVMPVGNAVITILTH